VASRAGRQVVSDCLGSRKSLYAFDFTSKLRLSVTQTVRDLR
jgi:hypothetical protein